MTNQLDRAEADRDDAAAERKELLGHVLEAQQAMEAHLYLLAVRVGASDKDRKQANESLAELLSELSFDARTEIQSRLSEAQDALSHAESMDERRSAPVVI